jgi:hypothetical protein
VLELDDASLTAVVRVLDEAGFEAVIQDAPLPRGTSQRQAGAWVRMPGEEAFAVVFPADVAPGDRPGRWRDTYGRKTPEVVRGYQVGFHERPFGLQVMIAERVAWSLVATRLGSSGGIPSWVAA